MRFSSIYAGSTHYFGFPSFAAKGAERLKGAVSGAVLEAYCKLAIRYHMETERQRTFVARWIAVVLLVVSWLAVGIRYLLDSEEDPKITTAFMICCAIGFNVWVWIWLKKRGRLKGNRNLVFLGHLNRFAFWAGITFFVLAAIGYLLFRGV